MKSIIIFFYQYVTSDDVIFWIYGQGDHKGSPIRTNQFLRWISQQIRRQTLHIGSKYIDGNFPIYPV